MNDYTFIFIAVNSVLIYKMCKNPKIHLLLKILLCISYFGWNVAPAILMHFFKDEYEITPIYLFCSYVNQIFLFATYCLSFYWMTHRRSPKFVERHDFQDSHKIMNLFLLLFIFLIVYVIVYRIVNPQSYLEGNDINNYRSISFIGYIADLSGCFIFASLIFYYKMLSKMKFRISLILLVSYFILLSIQGARINFVGVLILFFFYAFKEHNKKMISFMIGVSVFYLFLLPSMASLRKEGDISLTEAVHESQSSSRDEILDEILVKTNSVYTSSLLIRQDGIGSYGATLYSSTLFAIIPRFLYPTKPQPGSVDGTFYGLPSRRAAIYSVDKYNDILNVGTSTSIVALWSSGWVAYLIEIFTSALFIFLLNCFLIKQKIFFVALSLKLTLFPACILEVPLPQMLTQIQRYFIIYLILIVLFPVNKKNAQIRQ